MRLASFSYQLVLILINGIIGNECGYLKNGYRHRSNANIIVADFVDEEDFCRAIIDLNR